MDESIITPSSAGTQPNQGAAINAPQGKPLKPFAPPVKQKTSTDSKEPAPKPDKEPFHPLENKKNSTDLSKNNLEVLDMLEKTIGELSHTDTLPPALLNELEMLKKQPTLSPQELNLLIAKLKSTLNAHEQSLIQNFTKELSKLMPLLEGIQKLPLPKEELASLEKLLQTLQMPKGDSLQQTMQLLQGLMQKLSLIKPPTPELQKITAALQELSLMKPLSPELQKITATLQELAKKTTPAAAQNAEVSKQLQLLDEKNNSLGKPSPFSLQQGAPKEALHKVKTKEESNTDTMSFSPFNPMTAQSINVEPAAPAGNAPTALSKALTDKIQELYVKIDNTTGVQETRAAITLQDGSTGNLEIVQNAQGALEISFSGGSDASQIAMMEKQLPMILQSLHDKNIKVNFFTINGTRRIIKEGKIVEEESAPSIFSAPSRKTSGDTP